MSQTNDDPVPTRAEAARGRATLVLLGTTAMAVVVGCLVLFTLRGLTENLARNPAFACADAGVSGVSAYTETPGIHPVLAYRAIAVAEERAWSLDTAAVPEVWQPAAPELVELALCIDEAIPLTRPNCDALDDDVIYGFELPLRLVAVTDSRAIAATTLRSAEPGEGCLAAPAARPDNLVVPEQIWRWLTPYVVIPE